MDQRRQRDARIYLVSVLFFLCIIGGGLFLCLYIFLPESQTSDWYSIAGITLVAIPWAFWLLTCIYRCFKLAAVPHQKPQYSDSNPSLRTTPTSSSAPPSVAPPATTDSSTSKAEDNSLLQSSGGGERRVHFGAVIVMDNVQQPHHAHHDVEKGERPDETGSESEMPLRLSV